MNRKQYALVMLALLLVNPAHAAIKNLFGKTDGQIKKAITSLVTKGKKVKHALNIHFQEKEHAILQKIKNKYGISDQVWNESRAQDDDLVLNDELYKPTSNITDYPDEHWIIKKARELIASYGMNPEKVIIRESTEIPVAQVIAHIHTNSLTHYLDLNVEYLEALTVERCILNLKHEIMHLWYADSIYADSIIDLMYKNSLDPLYIEYTKNQEMRADIMAATESLTDALNYYDWLSKCKPDDTDDNNHPIFTKRLKAAERLYNYLLIEAEVINAA